MQWEFAVMFLLRISWAEACDTQHTDGVKAKSYISKHWLCWVRQLHSEKWVTFYWKCWAFCSAEVSQTLDGCEGESVCFSSGYPMKSVVNTASPQDLLVPGSCFLGRLWHGTSKMGNCATQSFGMSQWTSDHVIFICSWPLVWFYLTEGLLQALLWCRSCREGCGCCLGADSSRLQLLTDLMLHLTPVLLQMWLGVPPKSTACECTVSARKTLVTVHQLFNNVMGVWAGQWCWAAGSPEMECWLEDNLEVVQGEC